ncbi:MAG: pitrilysin family protein [Bacteroidales bacterium]|nr:pitrilysin family protein [Bacteroidales bacterium]
MTQPPRNIQPRIHDLMGELPTAANLPANFRFLSPEKISLPNSIPLYVVQTGSYDFCQIEIGIKAGTWYQNKKLQAGFTNMMLMKGCKGKTESEISEFIDYRGAYLIPSVDQDFASLSLYSLTRHLKELLPLMSDILQQPDFPESEFTIERSKAKQRFQIDLGKVDFLARQEMSHMVYGDNHPYGQIALPVDYEQIQASDLHDFYKYHYHNRISYILASGNISDDVLNLITQTFGGSGIENQNPIIEPNKSFNNGSPYFRHIPKAGASQTAIRFGKRAPTAQNPDYSGLKILNVILGGYFGSRLMMNIREDKGLTYGIGSAYQPMQHDGMLIIAAEVKAENTALAILETKNELQKLCENLISEEELYLVKNFMAGDFYRSIDGPSAIASRIRQIIRFDLPSDHFINHLQNLYHITPKDILNLSQKYLKSESFYSIAVGEYQD